AEKTVKRLEDKTQIKVNIAPDGRPYEARWRNQQIVTVLLSLLVPVFMLIGLLFVLVALPTKRKAT
ncbi:MAG: hypothetical protein AAGF20_12720, partial [Pseudomonadota bacterium]